MDAREHYTIAPDVMDQALNGDLGGLGHMVDQLGGGPVLNMNAVDYVLQKVRPSNQALIVRALLRWMAQHHPNHALKDQHHIQQAVAHIEPHKQGGGTWKKM